MVVFKKKLPRDGPKSLKRFWNFALKREIKEKSHKSAIFGLILAKKLAKISKNANFS